MRDLSCKRNEIKKPATLRSKGREKMSPGLEERSLSDKDSSGGGGEGIRALCIVSITEMERVKKTEINPIKPKSFLGGGDKG